MKVACPTCSAVLKVRDSYRGQRVRCPHCRTAFRLPRPKLTKPPPLPTDVYASPGSAEVTSADSSVSSVDKTPSEQFHKLESITAEAIVERYASELEAEGVGSARWWQKQPEFRRRRRPDTLEIAHRPDEERVKHRWSSRAQRFLQSQSERLEQLQTDYGKRIEHRWSDRAKRIIAQHMEFLADQEGAEPPPEPPASDKTTAPEGERQGPGPTIMLQTWPTDEIPYDPELHARSDTDRDAVDVIGMTTTREEEDPRETKLLEQIEREEGAGGWPEAESLDESFLTEDTQD